MISNELIYDFQKASGPYVGCLKYKISRKCILTNTGVIIITNNL